MDYIVGARELEPQPIVSIRARRASGDVARFLARSLSELFGRLRLLGVTPAGPPFVIYHEFGPAGVDAEVCVPVARIVSAVGRVRARVVPAGTVASTLHLGRYEQLGAAYAALMQWVHDSGFEAAGPIRERYLTGPGDEVAPAAYRTEVDVPIETAPIAVPA
jgi:effector-binding domain-containing protein